MARPIAPDRQDRREDWQHEPVPRPRRPRQRRGVRIVLATVTTFVFITGWSMGHALTVPGGGTVSERVAEWARGHWPLGYLVTFGEWLSYSAPKAGGAPSNVPGGGTIVQKAEKKKHHGIVAIIPPNIGSPAGTPLASIHEGVWRVVGSVHGVPAILKTYVRVDPVHTSYVAGIVSMDPRLLKFSLYPGTVDPGSANWGVPYDLPAGQRTGLLATFNSGFKVNASLGGFYLNGVHVGSLTTGGASEVFYRDGLMKVGRWGYNGLHMGPNVVGVRQSLKLIVIGGKVPTDVNGAVISTWGATLGGGLYVWRSGVCMTGDGRIVYVYGPSLSAYTLAKLLVRAGCVTAMQLDINPDWTSFMYYLSGKHPANPTPVAVLNTQVQSPYRYYSLSSRDFTAVFAR